MSTKQKAINATKQNDNKFKVIPNLSLRGKDIRQRLANGSLKLNPSNQYSLDTQIDATRRMHKIDIIHEAKKNQGIIENLGQKLKDITNPKQKP